MSWMRSLRHQMPVVFVGYCWKPAKRTKELLSRVDVSHVRHGLGMKESM